MGDATNCTIEIFKTFEGLSIFFTMFPSVIAGSSDVSRQPLIIVPIFPLRHSSHAGHTPIPSVDPPEHRQS